MFLATATLANVQSQFNAEALSFETVAITAIHATPKVIHIRYTLDGKDAVSVVPSAPGQRLHDALDDSIRWNAYYLMDEIRRGVELDEGVTDILRIWPTETQIADVVSLQEKRQAVDSQKLARGVSALQEKFNRNY
jgi:hypothetical protein